MGPRSAIKEVKEGMELPPEVYSFRKIKLLSLSNASERPEMEPYRLAKLVTTIKRTMIRNLLLCRWSPSSLQNSAWRPVADLGFCF